MTKQEKIQAIQEEVGLPPFYHVMGYVLEEFILDVLKTKYPWGCQSYYNDILVCSEIVSSKDISKQSDICIERVFNLVSKYKKEKGYYKIGTERVLNTK